MTFLERVQAVEAARGDGRAVPTRLSIDDLRREVGRRMPFEQVASVMAENPERARNELRAVCREVLSERAYSLPAHEQQRMIDEFVDVVFGMGPIEELVEDEAVTEIMVNGARSIYYERNGKLERSDLSFESDEQVRVLIDRIIGPLGRRIDESSPMVDARLPQGHRVNAVIPPLALDGPHVTIRSFSRRVMMLDEMVERGSFGEDVKALFELLVKLRKNVVVSGGTGSGKTTLSQLLPRFYDVTGGAVFVDGQDVRKVTQASLHRYIGIIQQDVFLFADTVRENIRYGRPGATDEEVAQAAILASIHEEILEMPNGYDTFVGERGAMLSGGQKQRIAIARVFLKNPPILVLDEATSALDSVTEAAIQASLEKLSRGRTTIVVAHRLATVRGADHIAVIDKEGVSEYGTHQELMEKNGLYAALWNTQKLS